jgi:hypothetical protein
MTHVSGEGGTISAALLISSMFWLGIASLHIVYQAHKYMSFAARLWSRTPFSEMMATKSCWSLGDVRRHAVDIERSRAPPDRFAGGAAPAIKSAARINDAVSSYDRRRGGDGEREDDSEVGCSCRGAVLRAMFSTFVATFVVLWETGQIYTLVLEPIAMRSSQRGIAERSRTLWSTFFFWAPSISFTVAYFVAAGTMMVIFVFSLISVFGPLFSRQLYATAMARMLLLAVYLAYHDIFETGDVPCCFGWLKCICKLALKVVVWIVCWWCKPDRIQIDEPPRRWHRMHLINRLLFQLSWAPVLKTLIEGALCETRSSCFVIDFDEINLARTGFAAFSLIVFYPTGLLVASSADVCLFVSSRQAGRSAFSASVLAARPPPPDVNPHSFFLAEPIVVNEPVYTMRKVTATFMLLVSTTILTKLNVSHDWVLTVAIVMCCVLLALRVYRPGYEAVAWPCNVALVNFVSLVGSVFCLIVAAASAAFVVLGQDDLDFFTYAVILPMKVVLVPLAAIKWLRDTHMRPEVQRSAQADGYMALEL